MVGREMGKEYGALRWPAVVMERGVRVMGRGMNGRGGATREFSTRVGGDNVMPPLFRDVNIARTIPDTLEPNEYTKHVAG